MSVSRRDIARTLAVAPLAASAPSAAAFAAMPHEEEELPAGGSITDVPGLRCGHHTLAERPTGCTVLLAEKGATAGVDVRGSAPGTRETDLLSPVNSVQQVNAILLSGGSAFGLNAAAGVAKYCEEKNAGVRIAGCVVPIVPAAILMDLGVGDPRIRPDADAGYQACLAATAGPVREGCVGAGAGATFGKLFGPRFMMKGGLGTASHKIPGTDIVVGAIVAVNAVGDVVDPRTGRVIAGARNANGKGFRNAMEQILLGQCVTVENGANTTIGAVATNASFTKVQMTKIAQMAHDGYARALNPVHTMGDGDTIFALSTGLAQSHCDVTAIGAIAAMVMARAIVRAAMLATSLPEFGIVAYRDYAGRFD